MTCAPILHPGSDLIGYAAASLVLMTFMMRGMLALRLLGLASNLAFLTYATTAGLMPILLLHLALIPVNLYRLGQLPQVRETIRTVSIRAGRARSPPERHE